MGLFSKPELPKATPSPAPEPENKPDDLSDPDALARARKRAKDNAARITRRKMVIDLQAPGASLGTGLAVA